MAVVRTSAGSRGACRQGGVCARKPVDSMAYQLSQTPAHANANAYSHAIRRGVSSNIPLISSQSHGHGHGHGLTVTRSMNMMTNMTMMVKMVMIIGRRGPEGQVIQGRCGGQGLQMATASVDGGVVSWSTSLSSTAAAAAFTSPDVAGPVGYRWSGEDIKMSGSGRHLLGPFARSTLAFSSSLLPSASSLQRFTSTFTSTTVTTTTAIIKNNLPHNTNSLQSSRLFSTLSWSSPESDIAVASPASSTSSSIGRIYGPRQPCVPSFLLSNLPRISSFFSFAMYRRYALGFPASRKLSTMSDSVTPIEDSIRAKVMAALKPTFLEIYNDSHLHAHHKPMIGSTSRETHFRIHVASEKFVSKSQPARHRMLYMLLSEEMACEGGIHALSLLTMTPEEEARRKAKAESQRTGGAVACNGSNH